MSDYILDSHVREAVESVIVFTARFFNLTDEIAKQGTAFSCLVYARQIGVDKELHHDIQFAAFEYWTKWGEKDDFDISMFDNCHALQMSDAIVQYKEMEEFAL